MTSMIFPSFVVIIVRKKNISISPHMFLSLADTKCRFVLEETISILSTTCQIGNEEVSTLFIEDDLAQL